MVFAPKLQSQTKLWFSSLQNSDDLQKQKVLTYKFSA